MNFTKPKRRRGVILTPQGLNKLRAAKSQAECCENDGMRYSLEVLSTHIGLDPDTLMKVLACKVGVDKRTLNRCFRAFNLLLEPSDYQLVATRFEAVEGQKVTMRQMQQDWGEAPDVSMFYGRKEELATLRHWILEEHCRVVTLLGMAGMGKTYVSVKLAEQIQDKFDFVIWRSLLYTPRIEELLAELIRLVSDDSEAALPETVHNRISRLIYYLQSSRCLLVFDNVETILQGRNWQERDYNNGVGHYCQGYEGYGELFKRLGETHHQSCLVLTSREKPKEIGLLEGELLPVRVFKLKGMQVGEVREIFSAKGSFCGSSADWSELVERYSGNPLALKIASTAIQELFDGRISEFLKQNIIVFGDLQNILNHHFKRLSDAEREIIRWLAINRQPASFSDLREKISPLVTPQKLLEALESLEEQCLIDKAMPMLVETRAVLFSLRPMVMEYVANQIIEENIPKVWQKAFSGSQHQRFEAIT